jgi:hypothetical protein
LLERKELANVKYLFLVGGFAECSLLATKIDEMFNNRLQVVKPPRPGVAVMGGAVLYGLKPDIITSRIMPSTIGIQASLKWNEELHKGKTQTVNDAGKRLCSECVVSFVTAGERILANHQVAKQFTPVSQHHTNMKINLYGSSRPMISFTSEKHVRQIGYLELAIPDVGAPSSTRVVDVVMRFGGTTFSAVATYRKTQECVHAVFNFDIGTILSILFSSNFNSE